MRIATFILLLALAGTSLAADLPEVSTWEDGIYQLEVNDRVQGGVDGISNRQAKELANRTKYLKDAVDTLAPNVPTADEKASFPAGASGENPLALSSDPRLGQFVGFLVADPETPQSNTYWIRTNTNEIAYFYNGEIRVIGLATSPRVLTAFPGCEGYGCLTSGGIDRAGTTTIYEVVNLNDSGAGSLRACVEAAGSRVCVFETSGRIDLATRLTISNPNITIAGETAPAPGITLYGNAFQISASDVLVRHIRSRANYSDPDQLEGPMILNGGNISNVVIDRCSLGWAPDENFTLWSSANQSLTDISVTNNIIHESLITGVGGQDGYGMIFGKNNPATVDRISVTKNLLTGNKTRNPLYKGGTAAIFANNVVYNVDLGAFVVVSDDYNGGALKATVTKNIFKDGPGGSPSGFLWFSSDSTNDGSSFYVGSGGASNASTDNIYKNTAGTTTTFSLLEGGSSIPNASYWKGSAAEAIWIDGLNLVDTSALENLVLASSGARPAERGGANADTNDARLVTEYQGGTGAIPGVGYYFPAPSVAVNSRSLTAGEVVSGTSVTWPATPDAVQPSGYTALEEALHALAAAVE